ncbi:MAG: hypothetical protein WBF53_03100 [Litorimonas sp.]
MKTFDFKDILGPHNRYLSTGPAGRKMGRDLGIAEAYAGSDRVKLLFPGDMIDVTPSFTVGLFDAAVVRLGSVEALIARTEIVIDNPDPERQIIAEEMFKALQRGFIRGYAAA